MNRKRKKRPGMAPESPVSRPPLSALAPADDPPAVPDDAWQSGHTSWSPYRPDLLSLLGSARMTCSATLPWGSNETFLVRLDGGAAGQSLAIYKPQLGEAPLWDFPDGTLYRREYASYLVSADLGWNIVPPTVVRGGPYGIGAVQLFIESQRRASYYTLQARDVEAIQRIAAFDCLVNNTDRKSEHCLLDREDRIWGIDHGLTFHRQPKLRTVIWDFADSPIPPLLLEDLKALQERLRNGAGLRRHLDDLLAPVEVAALGRRLDLLLSARTYPCPTSQRSVPWSMW
ncbi:MAG: SCO1664 family protein [Chloroflexota bacterium]